MAIDPSRLIYQLQNTGLQNKDNPLYQLLFQMIQIVAGLDKSVTAASSQSGGSSITNILGFPPLLSDSGAEGLLNDMLSIPGRDGTIGRDGMQGAPGLDGNDGEDAIPIPGPRGEDGANGMVPYYISSTETFTVPLYKQALFSMNIDNEGILDIEGFLIEVD